MTDQPRRELPDPRLATSWSELTEQLRELHRVCGRPTYDALSARCGLPKSAISYLIGKNPVRRPSRSAVERFVHGCLTYGSYSPAQIAATVEAYGTAWTRLPATEPTPVLSPKTDKPRPRRGPSRVVVLLAATAVAVTGSSAAAWALTHRPPAGSAAPSLAAPSKDPTATRTTAKEATCRVTDERQVDSRRGRVWPTSSYCRNRPTVVFAEPRVDDRPLATLDSTTSWFACWTNGRATDGRRTGEVWYYTQGDRDLHPRRGWEDWGFVSSTALVGSGHPLAGVRRCDF